MSVSRNGLFGGRKTLMTAMENTNQTDQQTKRKENRPEPPESGLPTLQRREPPGGEMGSKQAPPRRPAPGQAWLDGTVKRMNSGIYVDRVNVDWGMPYSFAARVTCRPGTKGSL